MKISKRDALMWYSFFAQLPEDEPLMPRQQELALAGSHILLDGPDQVFLQLAQLLAVVLSNLLRIYRHVGGVEPLLGGESKGCKGNCSEGYPCSAGTSCGT